MPVLGRVKIQKIPRTTIVNPTRPADTFSKTPKAPKVTFTPGGKKK